MNLSPVKSQVVEASDSSKSLILWSPTVGKELNALLEAQLDDDESKARVLAETGSILSRCVPPSATGSKRRTGLVVGYVQSGKTLSFTAVAAMARDNRYKLIVVLAGTSIPLSDQSAERLVEDLKLKSRDDRQWVYLEDPVEGDADRIKNVLADWDESTVPEDERRTVVVTVMKHHKHLDNLRKLLAKIELSNCPALIVDDEADQASLDANVNTSATRSTTNAKIVALRDQLPLHTFLQYTATPQAPLLINIIDVLSPDFAEVLTPGADYFGGKDFFVSNPSLIKNIPVAQVHSKNNPLQEAPETLIRALHEFFVGVAIGLHEQKNTGNRSMMVHPSQTTAIHAQYKEWVKQTKDAWIEILKQKDSDPDRVELEQEFRNAYEELRKTAPSAPEWDLVLPRIKQALRHTEITEFNARSGNTPKIDWEATYPHILIGGQAIDRGFTVEGLTVTYMPRDLGVGNADTVQQRARFFGYKRPIYGYCRVYLIDDVRAAFKAYVEHEDDVRKRLIEHRKTGLPLSAWKRAFFLDGNLRPTRDNVLQLDYMQSSIRNWFVPQRPHDELNLLDSNRAVISEFQSKHKFVTDPQYQREDLGARHSRVEVLLSVALEALLTPFRLSYAQDSVKQFGLLMQIKHYLEKHGDESCTVYLMSQGEDRKRSVDGGIIKELFQGRSPKNGPVLYPGDRAVRAEKGLTIQIHMLKVVEGTKTIAEHVPIMAVYVPDGMAADWVIQDE